MDEGEPADFGGQRSWLRWGMAIGAVVVIGIIVGVYFGVIRGGSTPPTSTLAPTTTALETTTSETEPPLVLPVWTDLAPAGESPNARSEHSAAYDTTNGLLVLFGGWDKSNVTFNDTWTYDAALNTWSKVTIPGKVPPARAQHQMVYDPASGKVILFGGISTTNGTQMKDLWAYDPTAKTWTELKPTGTGPSARSSFAMIYDDNAQKVILFGGWSKANSAHLNDTWAYDPTANTWTDLKPTGTLPSARGSLSMAYDQVESKVILFGGTDSSAYFNDTWIYDATANTWTQITATGEQPAARAGHRLAYDPASATVVLFGGWDGTAYYNDTWAFDFISSTWTNLNLAPAPTARDSHSLLYVAAINKLLLFGGYVGGTDVAQDTWSYGVNEETTFEDDALLDTPTDVIAGTTTTVAP